jgi:putative transposase
VADPRHAQIAAAHASRRATYEVPRIHAALRSAGTRTSRRRVTRLMHASGLTGCHRRRTRTTVVDPVQRPAPNLVARDFAAPAPNRLWLGDITYVRLSH